MPVTAASSASLTVAPCALPARLRSASGAVATAKRRLGPWPALSGVIGAEGRVLASCTSSSVARLRSPAARRGSGARARVALSSSSFCARTTGVAASRARWRVRSWPRGSHGPSGAGMSSGAGVGSSSTVPMSTAATPSTSAWCIFASSAARPSLRPLITVSSHSGRERSRRRDISRPTSSASSASPPGAGSPARRTCQPRSNPSSSTHTGLAKPAAVLCRRWR